MKYICYFFFLVNKLLVSDFFDHIRFYDACKPFFFLKEQGDSIYSIRNRKLGSDPLELFTDSRELLCASWEPNLSSATAASPLNL